jgi:SAM-dependent methyltransferase/uncharacterized protein YbaR (Trm112 family)
VQRIPKIIESFVKLTENPMKKSAEQYLVCPDCHSALVLTIKEMSRQSPDEILNGELSCHKCHQGFPILRGVPRFISTQRSDRIDVHTGERFADSWKNFSRLDARYEKQFFDWMAPVTKSFVKDKVVLDGGCGKGRHSQIVSLNGAKVVFTVDIGDAIDIAYENVGALPNVHVVQADINHLPFNPIFDYVFTNGVLHHMADPAAGFAALTNVVKPGGHISIWVYGAENNWWVTRIVNPIRVGVTSKLPAPFLKVLSWLLAIILMGICRGIYRPWLTLKSHFRVLPSLYYQDYMGYISNFDLTELDNIVFDHLVAPIAYYLSHDEVQSWFVSNGFSQYSLRWHNKNSWAGFGQTPTTDPSLPLPMAMAGAEDA